MKTKIKKRRRTTPRTRRREDTRFLSLSPRVRVSLSLSFANRKQKDENFLDGIDGRGRGKERRSTRHPRPLSPALLFVTYRQTRPARRRVPLRARYAGDRKRQPVVVPLRTKSTIFNLSLSCEVGEDDERRKCECCDTERDASRSRFRARPRINAAGRSVDSTLARTGGNLSTHARTHASALIRAPSPRQSRL